jgi:hypothetical protein
MIIAVYSRIKNKITMHSVWAAFANRQKSPTFAWNLQRAASVGDRAAQLQIGDMVQLKTNHHPAVPRVDHAAAVDLRDAIEAKLAYVLGKRRETANERDWYQATVLAVRDRVVDIWLRSRAETKRLHKKRVYYLSIEFLIGRLLDARSAMRSSSRPAAALPGNSGIASTSM